MITDTRTTNLTPAACDRIAKAGGSVLCVSTNDSRRLHGKVLHANGEGWALGLSGSANLSNAAYRGINAEVLVSRTGSKANAIGDLIDTLDCIPISPGDIERLAQRHEALSKDKDTEGSDKLPRIVTGKWTTKNELLLLPHSSVTAIDSVQISQSGVLFDCNCSWSGERSQCATLKPPANVTRETVALVRLVSDQTAGPWVVVTDPRELAEQAQISSSLVERFSTMIDTNFDVSETIDFYNFLLRVWNARRHMPVDQRTTGEPTDAEKPRRKSRWLWFSEDAFQQRDESSDAPLHNQTAAAPVPRQLIAKLLFGSADNLEIDDSESESELSEDKVDEAARAKDTRLSELFDDNKPADDPSSPDNGSLASKKRAIVKKEELSELVSQNRQSYFQRLQHADLSRYPVRRLFEEMKVLLGALHYSLRANAIGNITFQTEQAHIMRGFFGGEWSPFPAALMQLSDAERKTVWHETPMLQLIALMFYNTYLSHVSTREPSDPDIRSPANGVFWFRNLTELIDAQALDDSLHQIQRHQSRLKTGYLWLAHLWPKWSQELPFELYYKQLVSSTRAIQATEAYVAERAAEIDWQASLDEEDDVVRLTESGRLQPGFQESQGDRAGGPMVAWIRRDPFDSPTAAPLSAHVMRIQIVRNNRQQRERIIALSDLANFVDGIDDPLAHQGVELLSALAAE